MVFAAWRTISRGHLFSLRLVRNSLLWIVLGLVVYLASYAPFLRFVQLRDSSPKLSPYYRSPSFYRPVEWLIVKSQNVAPVQLWWAQCFGAASETEMQAFLFAQHIEDMSEIHWNIQ